MVDIEIDIFDELSKLLRKENKEIFITGEYVQSPSRFPAVSIELVDSINYKRTIDSGSNENHTEVLFAINVYSNLKIGKKTQCKEIIKIIDENLINKGFSREQLRPIPNELDNTIYRMFGLYRAVVSKDKKIYWR